MHTYQRYPRFPHLPAHLTGEVFDALIARGEDPMQYKNVEAYYLRRLRQLRTIQSYRELTTEEREDYGLCVFIEGY